MQRKKRNALGAVAMIVACAACCAMPMFLAGGVAGVLGGLAAELASFDGWLIGSGLAILVTAIGAWWFVRRRARVPRDRFRGTSRVEPALGTRESLSRRSSP